VSHYVQLPLVLALFGEALGEELLHVGVAAVVEAEEEFALA